ncbi:hypothetical protein [Mycobacteroides abscessus]|nr:hypothetical protein L836_5506 [Mycobacteroides abscessus MAB_110811_2726]
MSALVVLDDCRQGPQEPFEISGSMRHNPSRQQMYTHQASSSANLGGLPG